MQILQTLQTACDEPISLGRDQVAFTRAIQTRIRHSCYSHKTTIWHPFQQQSLFIPQFRKAKCQYKVLFFVRGRVLIREFSSGIDITFWRSPRPFTTDSLSIRGRLGRLQWLTRLWLTKLYFSIDYQASTQHGRPTNDQATLRSVVLGPSLSSWGKQMRRIVSKKIMLCM